MTFVGHRHFLLAATLVAVGAAQATAQRNDSQTWKLGFEAGAMTIATDQNGTQVVPTAGAHILIMDHRTGLMLGVDQGFGPDNRTVGYVLFNDVRRYSATLMAFPFQSSIEPYFGIGGGIMQLVSPVIDTAYYPDPTERANAATDADERSTSAFISAMVGIQGRTRHLTLFAQYQVESGGGVDRLLHGATMSLLAGVRVSLGTARDDKMPSGN